MITMVNAHDHVGTGFPPEEGTKLAKALLEKENVDWGHLTIDVSDLPSSLLISAFFNGFLQRVYDTNPGVFGQSRNITWKLAFDFQRKNVARWMEVFKPQPAIATKHAR